MRKLAIAVALASTAMATPAVARDHSFYAGLEGGGMIVEDMHLAYKDATRTIPDAYRINFGTGLDVDAIAGYDFGFVRLEGELGYKHASVDGINAPAAAAPILPNTTGNLDGGRLNILSGMVNALLDFGNDDGLSGYIGGGVGIADIKLSAATDTAGAHAFSDRSSHFAMQAIAGVRYAVSQNIDVGLKYRHFEARNLKFSDTFNGAPFTFDGSVRTNSLLASVIYNFYSPPPPPPPPPAPERG
jgi:opacity protein-like surface antigen